MFVGNWGAKILPILGGMESNDIWPVARKIAHKYGLDPEDLEAGSFLPEQVPVLREMLEKCIETGDISDVEIYLTAKAQMLYLAK